MMVYALGFVGGLIGGFLLHTQPPVESQYIAPAVAGIINGGFVTLAYKFGVARGK